MRIAKAILGLIGTAILGLLATYIMIPEWVLMNLEQHPWQTIGGFLISAALGGAVVFIAYATYMGWRLGDRPCKAFDDLRGIDALRECKSLADMVEPVRKLVAKDAKIAELGKRPEQSSEEQKVKSILASLDPDKLGLVGMVLARGSIGEHTEKRNRAFLAESGILARVEPSAIEAFASYTLTSIASAVIAGDEALRESAMKQGQELAGRIEKKVRIEAAQREDAEKAFEEKRKECEDLREEIADLKMRDSNLDAFRKKFKGLGPEDMEWVVRVYRAGRQGLEPSDDELTHFNDGVDIKKFLRLDAAGQRLFLVDGVEGMLDRCGDLVSYAMRVVCEQDVARAEARATAAEAKLAERDAEASRLAEDDRVLHMDYLTKCLLYAIATGDKFTTRDDDPSYRSANALNLEAFRDLFRLGLANYETCGMHELRWFGTELAAKLVEEHSDLFGKAKEEVEEIRRKEGAA